MPHGYTGWRGAFQGEVRAGRSQTGVTRGHPLSLSGRGRRESRAAGEGTACLCANLPIEIACDRARAVPSPGLRSAPAAPLPERARPLAASHGSWNCSTDGPLAGRGPKSYCVRRGRLCRANGVSRPSWPCSDSGFGHGRDARATKRPCVRAAQSRGAEILVRAAREVVSGERDGYNSGGIRRR